MLSKRTALDGAVRVRRRIQGFTAVSPIKGHLDLEDIGSQGPPSIAEPKKALILARLPGRRPCSADRWMDGIDFAKVECRDCLHGTNQVLLTT